VTSFQSEEPIALSLTQTRKPRIHPSHSCRNVLGVAPLRAPLRREDAVSRPKSQESSTLNECVNDASYLVTESLEQCGNLSVSSEVGRSGVSLSVPDYHAKNYLNFSPLHIMGRTITNHCKDLCAVFQLPGIENGIEDSSIWRMLSYEAKISLCDCTIGEIEKPVLVRVIQISQDGEKWRQCFVWSVVRLQRLENCPHRLADLPKPLLTNRFIKLSPAVSDRESELLLVRGRHGSGFKNCDSIDKVIQSSPQIVEAVSGHQGPSLERRWLVLAQNETVTGAISVHLTGKTVRFSVQPGLDFTIEGLSVFLAPGELGPNSY
jgi:hypothetical protein